LPLVLDPDHWTVERLRSELDKHLKGLEQLAAALESRRESSLNPHALDAGISLTRRSVVLAKAILEHPAEDRQLLASALNQLYEVLVGLPYFLRAASEPPKAPPTPARTTK
jgi:hypothetical protein